MHKKPILISVSLFSAKPFYTHFQRVLQKAIKAILLLMWIISAPILNTATAQTVSNGDFASGKTNWEACGNKVEANHFESTYGGPSATNEVAEIDGGGTGNPKSLCQDISGFTIGADYELTFVASRRTTGSAPNPVTVTIDIDGGLNTTDSRSNTVFSFTLSSFTFTATKTTHRLNITANFPGSSGFIIDDVAIAPVASLPVELSLFRASALGCETALEWSAESELEFSHYELQKTTSGFDFKTIYSINGKGDKATKNYAFTDTDTGSGSYYRLKLVDLDGSFEYSKTVHAATNCGTDNGEFTLSPNPVSAGEQLSVEFQSKEKIRTFYVLNSVGSLVRTVEHPAEEGYNKLKLDLLGLPAGLYFFSDLEQNTTRFLKQ